MTKIVLSPYIGRIESPDPTTSSRPSPSEAINSASFHACRRDTLADGAALAAVGDFGGATASGGGGVTEGFAVGEVDGGNELELGAGVGGIAFGVVVGAAALFSCAQQAVEKIAGQTTKKVIAVFIRTIFASAQMPIALALLVKAR